MSKKDRPNKKHTAPARDWMTGAITAAIVYLIIGRVFTWPRDNIIAWRWAAWIVSGVVFLVHVFSEHFRGGSTPKRVATHTALGVAMGGFLIAVAAFAANIFGGTEIKWANWLLALVAFPAVTAIPAFAVAYVLSTLLSRRPRPTR